MHARETDDQRLVLDRWCLVPTTITTTQRLSASWDALQNRRDQVSRPQAGIVSPALGPRRARSDALATSAPAVIELLPVAGANGLENQITLPDHTDPSRHPRAHPPESPTRRNRRRIATGVVRSIWLVPADHDRLVGDTPPDRLRACGTRFDTTLT